MNSARDRKKIEGGASPGAAVTSSGSAVTRAAPQAVTDSVCLDQGRVFEEAVRQTEPLTAAGSPEAAQAAKAVLDGTALRKGLRPETCERLVTDPKDLRSLISGANPSGKAAEVVVVADYRDLHTGDDPGITNSPRQVAPNVHDIRLSPDHASRKDLAFQFRTKDGMLITKPNGQVKTGSSQYVSSSLVRMAESPGYGKVGYVDSRFVNSDGTPRVAQDAFTKAQARRLMKAKVRLRGIPDLDARAERLCMDLAKHADDGLDPIARKQLLQLRDDLARAYRPKGVAIRVASGAAVAAATAAIVTLVVQAASGGEVHVATLGEAAGKGALFGVGGALADAGIYHGATSLGLAPEAASSIAQQGVAAGFCLIAIGADVVSEVRSARNGDLSATEAISGTAAKCALNLLPLVLGPLGIVGVPILIGAQLSGRWAIARARAADRMLELGIEEVLDASAQLHVEMDGIERRMEALDRQCQETDAIFADVMESPSGGIPSLQIVRQ